MIDILSPQNIRDIAQKTVKILSHGGIVMAPFDTVYGFICDPTNDVAIEKIFALKQRDLNKTIGIAVASLQELEKIAAITNKQFIEKKIPGRYTFILEAIDNRFSKYCYSSKTIGVRIPDNKLVSAITNLFGPIAQTSANKSGLPNCFSIQDIKQQFTEEELSGIDLIVDGGKIKNDGPSEIWDLTRTEPVKIER